MIRIRSLRNKITAAILSVVILFALVVAIIVNMEIRRALIYETKIRAVSMARNLSARSLEPLLTENMLEIKELVAEEKQLGDDVAYAFIIDSQGNVLAHTFDNGFPIELKDANTVSESQISNIQLLDTTDGFIYDVAVPISLYGNVLGATRLGITQKNVQAAIHNALRAIIATAILAILVSAFIGFILAVLITRPIERMRLAIEEIRKGNLNVKVGIKSKDEISELVNAFNKMADHLSKTTTTRDELAEEIMSRKKTEEELLGKVKELEAFHKLMVGREFKMIELKNRIRELEELLNKKE